MFWYFADTNGCTTDQTYTATAAIATTIPDASQNHQCRDRRRNRPPRLPDGGPISVTGGVLMARPRPSPARATRPSLPPRPPIRPLAPVGARSYGPRPSREG